MNEWDKLGFVMVGLSGLPHLSLRSERLRAETSLLCFSFLLEELLILSYRSVHEYNLRGRGGRQTVQIRPPAAVSSSRPHVIPEVDVVDGVEASLHI